jgi:phage anti-repressor protein
MTNVILPSFITSVATDLNTPTISVRDLYKFLEVKRDFSNWIKFRIEKYDFIENVDFVKHIIFGELASKGLQDKIDYLVSPHMAKELGMLENNPKGKAIRKYFINCEQQLINLLQKEINVKQRLLEQPNRVVLKRNSIKDLSELLGVPEFKLNTVLFDAGYCDDTGFPTSKAMNQFDCVDNEIRWSLPLVMKLLRV